ncbi:hypothetical protein [Methylocystis echinoides]|jgi:hypothetical protein|uniref:hypothetical protein n=1 Tax=Methylocystis echinoides TaxID=29468 RepID=UPI00342FBCA8
MKIVALGLAFLICGSAPARAVNTWAGNTAEDMAEEQDACAYDADRFCGGNTVFIFEMENCLKRHMPQLTRACRHELTPTDFRKYHTDPFNFF